MTEKGREQTLWPFSCINMQAPTLYICPGCPHPQDGWPPSSDNGPPLPPLRYLWSLSFHYSTTDYFVCVCVCLSISEQHIMETTHLSRVYLLRRRRHLQAGPLPQPKVRLSEGEAVSFFLREIVNKTPAPCLWVLQHIICISM